MEVNIDKEFDIVVDTPQAIDVSMNVSDRLIEQEKSLTVTKNDNYTIVPDEGKTLKKIDVEVNVIPVVKGIYRLFNLADDLPYIFDMTGHTETTMQYFAYDCWNIKSILKITNVSNITSVYLCFSGCRSLRSVDVSDWDVSKVTDFSYAFNQCNSLQSIDVSKWDVSKGTNFNETFCNCYSLQSIDVSKWDVSSAISLSGTFVACSGLQQINVSNWNPLNATLISRVFMNCEALKEINVSNWNTSKATSLFRIFWNCKSLESIDVSSWDLSSCIELDGLFYGCDKLKAIDVSNWNTSKVITMDYMFSYVKCDLDLSNWDCSNVTSTSGAMWWDYTGHSLIGNHTIEEVENDEIVCMKGWNTNHHISRAHYLRYSTILAIAKGLPDCTGSETALFIDYSTGSWNHMYNDDDTVPDNTTITERQTIIRAICANKNWTLAVG